MIAELNANYYLLTAASLAAGAVLTPQGPGAPLLLAAMACAVARYATSPGADFGLAMVFCTYVFQMTTIVLLRRSDAGNDHKSAPAKLPRTSSGWLLLAFTNPRFIGWGWERPLARRSETRTAFLWRYAKDLAATLVVLDACHAYFAANAWFAHDAPVRGVRLATLPAWEQAANAAAWGVYAYILWFLPYTVLALLSVATRICGPEDYPVLCAPFSDANSLRGFWGKVWHQSHRNVRCAMGEGARSRAQAVEQHADARRRHTRRLETRSAGGCGDHSTARLRRSTSRSRRHLQSPPSCTPLAPWRCARTR